MSKLPDTRYPVPPIRTWMGRYPRKGADWSLEEDQALIREYESGRYLIKQIAARHLREPVAIERRLGLLHTHSAARLSVLREGDKAGINQVRGIQVWGKLTPRHERDWRIEQEKAQRALDGIKATFASTMWPGERDKTFSEPPRQRRVKPGTLFRGSAPYIAVAYPRGTRLVALTDLPPEVAQALQFGQGEDS